jgi:hypothetical protein
MTDGCELIRDEPIPEGRIVPMGVDNQVRDVRVGPVPI